MEGRERETETSQTEETNRHVRRRNFPSLPCSFRTTCKEEKEEHEEEIQANRRLRLRFLPMKKIFGAKKNQEPPPSIQDATDRVSFCLSCFDSIFNSILFNSSTKQSNESNQTNPQISKRGDSVDDKIKKLDAELARYKDQIKKTRPGPAQEAIKARAMRVLKQRRMYISPFFFLFHHHYLSYLYTLRLD